jgi:hypothetical protein
MFLAQMARITAAGTCTSPLWAATHSSFEGKIMTVLGPVPPGRLGKALSHEHGVVDFLGAEKATRLRHDRNEAQEVILPHLQRLKELGCASLVECTPNFIGRDVRLLKNLAAASGLNILTNTGYYGAAGNKFLPRHAFIEKEDQLVERWLKDWRDGIDGSGVRPGFIKLGVEKGKLPGGPANAQATLLMARELLRYSPVNDLYTDWLDRIAKLVRAAEDSPTPSRSLPHPPPAAGDVAHGAPPPPPCQDVALEPRREAPRRDPPCRAPAGEEESCQVVQRPQENARALPAPRRQDRAPPAAVVRERQDQAPSP